MRPNIIGVTGQIATGKSLCCEMLSELIQAEIISLDRMVHELYNNDPKLLDRVRIYFPEAIEGKKLNRHILATIVFSHPGLRKKLESLVMPVLHKALQQKLRSLKAKGVSNILIEAPLLLEYNFDRYCDIVILLTSSKKNQLKRALAREGANEEGVLLRRKAQTPTHRARPFAEIVLSNNGDKEQLRSKLKEIFS